jgi:hypothetical protein
MDRTAKLQWNRVTTSDLSHYLIKVSPGNFEEIIVSKDSIEKQIDSLDNFTRYTFSLHTVDRNGNTSKEDTTSAVPYKRLTKRLSFLPSGAFDFTDVWGTNKNNIYAVGYDKTKKKGAVLKFIDQRWENLECPIKNKITSISGISDTSIFVTTEKGELYRYNTEEFTLLAQDHNQLYLSCMQVVDSNEIWMGGIKTMLAYNGSAMVSPTSNFNDTITDICLGENGTLYSCDTKGYLYTMQNYKWKDQVICDEALRGLIYNQMQSEMVFASDAPVVYILKENQLTEQRLNYNQLLLGMKSIAYSPNLERYFIAGIDIYGTIDKYWLNLSEESNTVNIVQYNAICTTDDGFVVAVGDNNTVWVSKVKL